MAGAGEFRLNEPGTVGDLIRFGVAATSNPGGPAHGRFTFRHARPDGTVAAWGWADVTCLRVSGNVALFTAIVPGGEPGDPVKNHGYYVKVIDGGRGPDQVA